MPQSIHMTEDPSDSPHLLWYCFLIHPSHRLPSSRDVYDSSSTTKHRSLFDASRARTWGTSLVITILEAFEHQRNATTILHLSGNAARIEWAHIEILACHFFSTSGRGGYGFQRPRHNEQRHMTVLPHRHRSISDSTLPQRGHDFSSIAVSSAICFRMARWPSVSSVRDLPPWSSWAGQGPALRACL